MTDVVAVAAPDAKDGSRGESPSSSSSESSRSRKRRRRSNFVATLKGGGVIQSYEDAQADPNISAEDLLDHMVAAEAAEAAEAADPPKIRVATGFSDGAGISGAHGPAELFGGARGRPSSPRRTDFAAGAKVNCQSKEFHIPKEQAESLITSNTKQAIIEESGLQEVTLDVARRKISVCGSARQIEKASVLLQRVTTHCRWGVNVPKIQAILRPRTTLSVARCTLSPMMTALRRFSTSLTAGKPTISLGTDPKNSLVIRGPMCSRVHAQLEFVPSKGVMYVVDQSTNGTWLNGRRLPEKGSAKVVLWHGDELLLMNPAAQKDGGEFGYIVNIEMD